LLSNCCQNRAAVGIGQGLRATSFKVLGTTWLVRTLPRGQVCFRLADPSTTSTQVAPMRWRP